MIIKANIRFNKNIDEYSIYNSGSNICIEDKLSGNVIKYSYNVNNAKIILNNLFRKLSYLNYCGAGFQDRKNGLIFSIFWYLNFRYKFFRGIKDLYNKIFS